MNLIEKLKKNEKAFMFLTREEQNCFEVVGKKNCLYLYDNGVWSHAVCSDFGSGRVYRIRADYQPEPEIEVCEVFTGPYGEFFYKKIEPDAKVEVRPISNIFSDPDFIKAVDKDGNTMKELRLYVSDTEPAAWSAKLYFRKE